MEYKIGNLIAERHQYDVIVHGCNCHHSFGAGIAKTIADEIPAAFEEDLKTGFGDYTKFGAIGIVPGTPIIVNAYTQFYPGKGKYPNDNPELRLKAIRSALTSINNEFKTKTIGLPRIGAGLAGGNWDEISEMIPTVLKDCKPVIVIWDRDIHSTTFYIKTPIRINNNVIPVGKLYLNSTPEVLRELREKVISYDIISGANLGVDAYIKILND